ncbi:MAG: SDR family NAD(P)-dependent oxidoreductase [Pirellulales bacterium]
MVNIGSILGHRATPQNAEYCASKFALRGWTQSVRAEFAALGIDLVLVSPGTTESEFYHNTLGETKSPPWGMPPAIPTATVAARIVRAMERGTPEIVPSARGIALVWANRFFPGIVDRVMRKYG